MQRRIEIAIVCAVIAATAIAILATQPRDVFWGPDSGNRFIQLRSFLRTGALAIDDAPPAGHHFVRTGEHVYSFYSPIFPLVTAPFYTSLGTWGLFLFPLIGTLATALLLSPLLERDYIPAVLAAVFATPLFWYTVVFWEHTLAVALSLGAYVLVTRNRLFAAGCVAAVGTAFREEGYIVIAAIAAALLITRRPGILRFLAGALLLLIPLWIANAVIYGRPLGLHAKVYTGMGGPRLSNWWVYLFEFSRWPGTMRDTLYTQGFVVSVPFTVAIVLARARDRFLVATIMMGLLLTPLLLNQADFGIIWGPRHFLWLIPLVIAAAAPALRRSRASAAITIALMVAGVAIQIAGFRLLREKLVFSETLVRAAAAPGKPIVTDVFWIPEDLAALYGTRPIRLVNRDDEIPRGPIVFIASRATRVVPGRLLAGRILGRTPISMAGDPMLEAVVLDCR
jgi:type IV secretory pathway VirB3-like protein